MILLDVALHFQICYEGQIKHRTLSILLFASCHLPFGRLLFRDSISVHIYISLLKAKKLPKERDDEFDASELKKEDYVVTSRASSLSNFIAAISGKQNMFKMESMVPRSNYLLYSLPVLRYISTTSSVLYVGF